MKPLILVPVKMKRGTDCAIVAISTLTGKSYEKVLAKLLPRRKKHAHYGASVAEIERCLASFRISYRERKGTPLNNLDGHALVVIKFQAPREKVWSWHAVVFDGVARKILDDAKWGKNIRFYDRHLVHCFEVI